MATGFKIAIIGSGNVGYHLAVQLRQVGQTITQVFSRDIAKAETIARLTKAEAIDNLDKLRDDADIYLVCVKDDSIEDVAGRLKIGDKIIAHTSGSVPQDVLKAASPNYGVFYPLQSFSKNVAIDFSNVPIFIEAGNAKTKDILLQLARSLTKEVHEADYNKRMAVHIAGVFANNFTNHLFAIAGQIMEKEGLSFKLLLPLINETIKKIQSNPPAEVQTGPALRNDIQTIQKHIDYLAGDENLKVLYELLSKNIAQLKK